MRDTPNYYPLVSQEHALYAGAVMGLAWKNGIRAEPVVDEDGNYTAELWVILLPSATVRLVIPEPPVNWSIRDWMPK